MNYYNTIIQIIFIRKIKNEKIFIYPVLIILAVDSSIEKNQTFKIKLIFLLLKSIYISPIYFAIDIFKLNLHYH